MNYSKLFLAALLGLLQFFVQAQSTDEQTATDGVTLSVHVKNISSDNGHIVMGLYDSEQNFIESVSVQSKIENIKDGLATIVFNNVPAGIYAIKCFHDANDNGQLDFEGFMPIEDYGVSNNPTLFGPPQFAPAKFEVNETNLTFEISL